MYLRGVCFWPHSLELTLWFEETSDCFYSSVIPVHIPLSQREKPEIIQEKAGNESVWQRFTLTVTSCPSGEIEEQRAVRYLKFLHSESTGWRASEIYNKTLSSFPSGYKPLRCFLFFILLSSFLSPFLPFSVFSHVLWCENISAVKVAELNLWD